MALAITTSFENFIFVDVGGFAVSRIHLLFKKIIHLKLQFACVNTKIARCQYRLEWWHHNGALVRLVAIPSVELHDRWCSSHRFQCFTNHKTIPNWHFPNALGLTSELPSAMIVARIMVAESSSNPSHSRLNKRLVVLKFKGTVLEPANWPIE